MKYIDEKINETNSQKRQNNPTRVKTVHENKEITQSVFY